MDYSTFGEDVGINYVYIESDDHFPIHNQWRAKPLSDNAWIRPNVCGYYPYPRSRKQKIPIPEPQWQFAWAYPASTVFPANPQYQLTKYIFLER